MKTTTKTKVYVLTGIVLTMMSYDLYLKTVEVNSLVNQTEQLQSVIGNLLGSAPK